MVAPNDCQVADPGIDLRSAFFADSIQSLEQEVLGQRTVGAAVREDGDFQNSFPAVERFSPP
jgi:hypothetical protein